MRTYFMTCLVMPARAAALAFGLLGTAAVAQTTVDVPIDEARVIATRALLAGETGLALQIARSLLQVNPDDRTALLVVAAGAPRVGQPAEGRQAGARAFRLSETDVQRYEAARLTALAAANEERYTLATFWLRRALTVVPNEEERARTIRDAAGVRRANPWSTNLSISIVPSNNVNGGTDDAELEISGEVIPNTTLSADSLALSGVRGTLNFRTQYRFYSSPRDRAAVAFQYQGVRVKLQDEEVEDPRPGSTATIILDPDDFASDLFDLSLIYDRALENGTFGARINFGSFDFGGEPYYDYRRLSFSRNLSLTEQTTLLLSAQREWQDYESNGIRDVIRTTLRSGLSYRRENGDRVTGFVGRTDSDGFSQNFTFEEWSLQGSYSWAEPIGPISLGVSGGIKTIDYPEYALFGPIDGGREDNSLFYGVDIGFPGIEYAGFSPGLAISGSIAESNISRFTRDTFSVGFTLNSVF